VGAEETGNAVGKPLSAADLMNAKRVSSINESVIEVVHNAEKCSTTLDMGLRATKSESLSS